MNRKVSRRLAKKIAKRYLDGGDVSRYLLGAVDYWASSTASIGELVFPGRIERAILHEAKRRGWDGCHLGKLTFLYL